MCGVSALFGRRWLASQLDAMVASQRHRGPDGEGIYLSPAGLAALGHNRLSIIDLSEAGRQPMADASGRFRISFNGEIYNYPELRAELAGRYPFRTRTDTEVLLAAYLTWGEPCLHKLIGMFAFVIWDERERVAFGARDRFGVKPLYYHEPAPGELWLASEIKALRAAGLLRQPNAAAWSTYLVSGMHDHGSATFWNGIHRIPAGACFTWSEDQGLRQKEWYGCDRLLADVGTDSRPEQEVIEELEALLIDSTRLRFRSDVPVGVCLSGGLDSSLLLALVQRAQGPDSSLKSFTFHCDDPAYDETPWVKRLLAGTRHPALFCRLTAEEVPSLAAEIQAMQDEPFGGLPTLGMAKVHQRARQEGITVLLDGNGLDEGWAGYEYYHHASQVDARFAPVQGSKDPSTRPECLTGEFAALAMPAGFPECPNDPVAALQCRDLRLAKLPRALRFADRVSMMYGRELREPFLDHRTVELGMRQPADRKLREGQGKYLPRKVAARLLPQSVQEAPKRPVQTPQREWLRGPLRTWATAAIEAALAGAGRDWLQGDSVRAEWDGYCAGKGDNSLYVWQWISLGLLLGA